LLVIRKTRLPAREAEAAEHEQQCQHDDQNQQPNRHKCFLSLTPMTLRASLSVTATNEWLNDLQGRPRLFADLPPKEPMDYTLSEPVIQPERASNSVQVQPIISQPEVAVTRRVVVAS
jgi:hypothetical protein